MKHGISMIAVSLSSNSLEILRIHNFSTTRIAVVVLSGHRTCIRSAALSHDDAILVTASSSGSKVWNPLSGTCLLTSEKLCHGLVVVFLPIECIYLFVLGTNDGKLVVANAESGIILNTTQAHCGPLWSLCLLP